MRLDAGIRMRQKRGALPRSGPVARRRASSSRAAAQASSLLGASTLAWYGERAIFIGSRPYLAEWESYSPARLNGDRALQKLRMVLEILPPRSLLWSRRNVKNRLKKRRNTI